MEVVGLLRGVALERRLLLGNLLVNAAAVRRHKLERGAQDGLHLLELVGIVGCKEYFHRCQWFGVQR